MNHKCSICHKEISGIMHNLALSGYEDIDKNGSFHRLIAHNEMNFCSECFYNFVRVMNELKDEAFRKEELI